LALLGVTVLVGVLVGWSGDAAWRSAQATDALLHTAGLSVVVTDAQDTGDSPIRLTADLTVHLTNLGLVPVELIGAETTYGAAAVVAIDPPHVTIQAHDAHDAVLEVAIGCRSPQPLDLPPLQLQAPDGSLQSVLVDGGGQALAHLCDGGSAVDHVLRLVSVTRDANQLKIQITASSGRTTQVQAIRAGGVTLTAHPLPAAVDGAARTLWLDQPAGCPLTWQRTGFPESLDVDVDIGSDATVTVPIGYALAAWLLDGPCTRHG
jgi:hypothetical protein